MALGTGVQYAGEYNLEECKLFSSTGVTARLDANVIEFNLFENMFVSGLVASLVIVDQNNLVMNMPIVGQEFISIKLTTKGIGSFDFTENVFCVHRVGARQRAPLRLHTGQLASSTFQRPEPNPAVRFGGP